MMSRAVNKTNPIWQWLAGMIVHSATLQLFGIGNTIQFLEILWNSLPQVQSDMYWHNHHNLLS
jgi:hypothetical protein